MELGHSVSLDPRKIIASLISGGAKISQGLTEATRIKLITVSACFPWDPRQLTAYDDITETNCASAMKTTNMTATPLFLLLFKPPSTSPQTLIALLNAFRRSSTQKGLGHSPDEAFLSSRRHHLGLQSLHSCYCISSPCACYTFATSIMSSSFRA